MQRINLYGNGSAVITRNIEFKDGEPQEISLPVKKDHLDEVVASLSVYGDVELPEPPSFSPENVESTDLTLDANNVHRDLATKLAGSEVEIISQQYGTFKGHLVGIQTQSEIVGQTLVEKYRIVVCDESGLCRSVPSEAISSIRFLDEKIQTEIKKALKNAIQNLRPDSKFITLKIVPKKSKEAILQFTVPVAAWKMRYGLRSMGKGKWELNAQAVVDNNTDEDWRDALITVVTGEPITFSTDLAEVKLPQRQRYDLVAEKAAGAVVAAPEMAMGFCAASMDGPPRGGARALSTKSFAGALRSEGAVRAQQAEASIREAGSFFEYSCQTPVSIPAKRSAVVPLFNVELNSVEKILYFNHKESDKPFRALRWRNSTGQTLGKGVCSVFEDGTFLGKAIITDTQKNQESVLIHAVEGGVSVKRSPGQVKQQYSRIAFKNGLLHTTLVRTSEVSLALANKRDESFVVNVEHSCAPGTKIKVTNLEANNLVETKDGYRLTFPLKANGRVDFNITDLLSVKQEVTLDTIGALDWFRQNVLYTDHPLAENKAMQALLKVEGEIAEVQEAIQNYESDRQEQLATQKRLQELLKDCDDETKGKWRKEIVEAETQFRSAGKSIKEGQKKIAELEKRLSTLVESFSVDWGE